MKCFPALLRAGLVLLTGLRLVAAEVPVNASATVRPALVREWTPPVYPPDALKKKIDGPVQARIVVDENGVVTAARVLRAASPELGEAAVTALKKWKFTPAQEAGNPVPMSMDVLVEFNAVKGAKTWKPGSPLDDHLLPQPALRTPAAVKNSPKGAAPASLTERRLSGEVVFTCIVQPDGRATNVQILGATHPDFVLPALAALERWECTPAKQGDLPVRDELRTAVYFDSNSSSRAEVLAANAITVPDGSTPAALPVPNYIADPAWPYALLIKGESGSAKVEFTVDGKGFVSGVKVLEATHPDFGRALAAAMEQWAFNPASGGGKTIPVTLVKRAEFKAPVADASSGDPVLAQLLRQARTGEIPGGVGLDEKLTPLYQAYPAYPASLHEVGRPAGEAVVEFIVDREGRVRLPRIISATHDEFGWAAATCVTQWAFKAPTRHGKPTEVKVQIAIKFAAPEA